MSRDGNGVYTLPAGNPVVAGTIIDPTWANATLNDIADALTESFSPDNQANLSDLADMNLAGLADNDMLIYVSATAEWANAAVLAQSGLYYSRDTDGTLAANSDNSFASQKAIKTYVDARVSGLAWKAAVRVATNTSGSISTAFDDGSTVDGIVIATGDRILVKDQTNGENNGIYIVQAAGAPVRATDADTAAEMLNATVFVTAGTANALTSWTCTTNPITLGTTVLVFAQQASSAGVADGDKGDVTVSGSGATWTIDNDAVTYAKMQNVSATSRVLGRKTAAAGNTEECTLSEVLDMVGSAAQGDVLYRGAATWTRLGAGTSGQFLQTLGAASNPAWAFPIESFPVACSDETTALSTGTAKITFRMPYAFTLTGVRASLSTAQTGGSIFTVDINEGGASVISTKLTIDNTEKTSTTAATPAVISDSSLADDAEMTVDIDQIGDGTAKGLKIYLIGRRTS